MEKQSFLFFFFSVINYLPPLMSFNSIVEFFVDKISYYKITIKFVNVLNNSNIILNIFILYIII